jgi:hypothetical protein
MNLSLRFDDSNYWQHDDITLRLGERTWIVDSYALALDNFILPRREDAAKVRVVLQRLLEQWLAALDTLPDGDTVYLPYDFADQHTGWLRCRRSGAMIEVCAGRSHIEGWSFCPSEIGIHLRNLPGFRTDGEPVHALAEDVIKAVRASIDATSQ